jgi:lysophospholipase L1-like esterase
MKPGGWPVIVACFFFLLLMLTIWIANAVYAGGKIAALSGVADDRFAAEDGMIIGKNRSPALVIVGDSRAARWAPLPRVTDGETLLRGVGGETTVQAERRLADAVRLRPAAILLMTGVNDIVAASYMVPAERHRTGEEAAARIVRMTRLAKASGVCVMVATVAPPARPGPIRRIVWRSGIIDDVVLLNSRVRREIDADIPVLDVETALARTDRGYLAGEHSVDTLHFNAAAYARLNDVAAELLERCRLRPFDRPRE